MVESGGERQRAGAFRDHPGAFGEEADRGGGLVERDGERAVERFRARVHIAGSTAGEPEPSTNETWYSTGRGSPRSNAAVSGAPVSGSTA